MIFKIGVLANRAAGQRLRKNIAANAVNNHAATSKMVTVVTTGLGTKISSVVIMPKEIPTAKLENKTTMLWTARIAMIAFGFVPVARKIANS